MLLAHPARGETDNAFALGQIIVTAPRDPAGRIAIGSTTLSSEAIYAFNRNTLDEAANLIPGVSSGNSGGSRNERLIFVRGFDRFQVPLSIDGIRVYLPADNRLDFGRFLTPDIAELQVAKGYASVLDGPGAMGGAINLVTRKPTKALEAEARGTLTLDRDGGYAGHTAFALVGTRQDRWYAQASYTRNVQDHWDLPGHYTPTPGSAEDGGERDFSRTRDWRVNAKLGFTPNTTDEYAISYTRQEGAKNAPLHARDGVGTQRFWTWPFWNIDSLYFLSTTALGNRATLRTRIYRNSFGNLLRAFDNRTQTTQMLGRAFNSYYEDKALGGSADLAVNLTPALTLSLAAYYRRDEHVEYQQGFPSGATEPDQTTTEDTWSIAAEKRLALSPTLRLTAGVSYDWRDLKRAEDFAAGAIIRYPLRNVGAFNWQGQVEWEPSENSRIAASVSRRARFPTIFERFSTQFGGAASNPDLRPERATNYELSAAHRLGPIRVEGAIFYSRIDDAIVSVRLPSPPAPANTNQRRNLGDGEYHGAEVSLTADLGTALSAGANYSYIHRGNIDFGMPADGAAIPPFQLADVPTHKAFVWAEWRPIEGLRILPNVDIAGERTMVTTSSPPGYYRTGDHVLVNFRVDYAITDAIEIGIGARNLFDELYELADGFPEPGRSMFVSGRVRL